MAIKISRPSGTQMLTMPISQLLIKVSLPMMISMLVQSTYNMVDSMFVARMSETALSATSLSNPLQHIMMSVSVGTGVGISSLLARTLGEGKKKEADNVATTGLILAVLSCIVFVLFGLFAARPYIGLFTDDPELLQLGTTYLSLCTIFSLGIFVATTAERLLQATGNTFLSMVAQASGAVINCILDPLLIFGIGGFEGFGIAGAAIATVIGQWAAAIIALILNFRLNTDIRFSFRGFRMNAKTLKGIYAVAFPNMLVSSLYSVQTMIINKMLISVSATLVAFYGMFSKVQSFMSMPFTGMSQSLIPIVGQAYGARLGSRIREAVRIYLTVAIIAMSVCMLIFLFFPGVILHLFSAQEELTFVGMSALRILSPGIVLMLIYNIIGNVFTAVGNGKVNLINSITRYVVPLPIVYLMVRLPFVNGIWCAILFGDVLTAALSLIRYRRLDRKKLSELVSEEKAVKASET